MAKRHEGGTAIAERKGRKKMASQGDRFRCGECGLVVTVDNECGCAEGHKLVCCDKPMDRDEE